MRIGFQAVRQKTEVRFQTVLKLFGSVGLECAVADCVIAPPDDFSLVVLL